MSQIRIRSGSYRNFDAAGKTFELVKQYQPSGNPNVGGYVTVKNDGVFAGMPEVIRIKVSAFTDYEFVGEDAAPTVSEVVAQAQAITQTDEERMAEIAERFDILNDMSKACIAGDIRAMIVSGPPGVGKSYTVEREVEKAQLLDQLAGTRLRAEVVKGSATPIGLYQTLYKYSDKNCVLVFDDADQIFFDPVSLNLLKGALDTGKKRKISWLAESAALRREGIPDSFNFHGSVIFLTNISFENVKSKVLKDHLEALQSRCHFVELKMDNDRDKLLRIKQLINEGMLDDYEFDESTKEDVIEFLVENKSRLREISLRSAIKTADLRRAFPDKWRVLAKTSLLKSL